MVDIISNNDISPLFVCDDECYWWSEKTGEVFDSKGKNRFCFSKNQVLLLSTLKSKPEVIFNHEYLIDILVPYPGDFIDDIGMLRARIHYLRNKIAELDPDLKTKIKAKHKGYAWVYSE